MYRIIHVRIYTVAIFEVIFEVVAWPGVGEGIRSVSVEYKYISLYNLMICNAAKQLEQNPEWALHYTLTWRGERIHSGRNVEYCTTTI
jgi:hypothetical protein